jgi:putative intracellular protease/amidase
MVVIALASRDFDPTEVVVPWQALRQAGYTVRFATDDGHMAACDPLLLTGPFFGQLGAKPANVALYRELERDAAFQTPLRFADVGAETIAGLVLPGGHAPGMRPYLESRALQGVVRACFARERVIGAICHGGVVLARTRDDSGRSVIHGRTVTALTKSLERTAYWLTGWKLGRYYRTYPAYVEDEVTAALQSPVQFRGGPLLASYDNPFVVQDGRLITARWPGDATGFAAALVAALGERRQT